MSDVSTKFDELFESSSALVLDRQHRCDEVPVDGGRWPMTVIGEIPDPLASMMHDLAAEAANIAETDHFRTGHRDASHLTIRAMEPYREAACPEDDLSMATVVAMEKVAARHTPLALSFTGLTLTPGTVMAQLEPQDGGVWELMRDLEETLGNAGDYERDYGPRDLTYINLIHFTGPICDPGALVDWVAARRSMTPVPVRVDELSLIRTRYAERPPRMRLERWATVSLVD